MDPPESHGDAAEMLRGDLLLHSIHLLSNWTPILDLSP